ncbi:twin-arginine translocase TatA/TatE family subunit [Patescibacteria group bacterium]
MGILNFVKNISPTELIIILLILIVIFGRKAVTRLGRTGGETLKEAKNIKKSFLESIEDDGPKKKEVSK